MTRRRVAPAGDWKAGKGLRHKQIDAWGAGIASQESFLQKITEATRQRFSTEGNEDNEGKRSKVAQKPVALALRLLR
jgi:hypothetical protein